MPAAVRALKMHGGGPPVVAGKPLDNAYRTENVEMVRLRTSRVGVLGLGLGPPQRCMAHACAIKYGRSMIKRLCDKHLSTARCRTQVAAGAVNLQRHVANARAYGVPVVVAINKFASDTPAELDAVRTAALEAGETQT